ncbi:FAD-binding protein [Aestuariivirga sp.]|uniref:FAD-binding protein n=1 Tax=Aestuariivirga sp. TaxID=2650926 RepID=UPI0039E26010
MAHLTPSTPQELADMIAQATGPFELVGLASKRGLGRPVQAAHTLDLSAFSGIIAYEPEELILEAGPATPMREIDALLKARGQQLAFEPPDLSHLLGTDCGSLGGVIACNLSGPRRLKAGAARDHILGVSGVTGRGDIVKAGARVVKNVTGYDLPKLITGSYGTLMAMTSVIVKVLPAPETEQSLLIEGLSDAEAVKAMSLAMQSPFEVSAAAHVPGQGTLLRLEGVLPSVNKRREELLAIMPSRTQVIDAEASCARWLAIRDVEIFKDPRQMWRLSVTPSEAPAIVAGIAAKADARWFYDWAGGLIWLDLPSTEDAHAALVRGALTSGHATLVRAEPGIRANVDVFQPQAPALSALAARVKASFDPQGLLNPGRMDRSR